MVLCSAKSRPPAKSIWLAVCLRCTFSLETANNYLIQVLDTVLIAQLIRATERPFVIGDNVTDNDPRWCGPVPKGNCVVSCHCHGLISGYEQLCSVIGVFVIWLCFSYPSTASSMLSGIAKLLDFTYDKMLRRGECEVGSQVSCVG